MRKSSTFVLGAASRGQRSRKIRRKLASQFLAGCFAVGLMLAPASARAEPEWYLNPGIKLGYTWGEGGGFTLGLEASATRFQNREDFGYGPVVNIDYRWGNDIRLRIGAEGCRMGVGVEAGLVASLELGKLRFGFAATPWVGVVLIPYYTFTMMFDGTRSHEFGSYAKVPFLYEAGNIRDPLFTLFPYIDD